jgi:hypothetical protein
LSEELKQRDVSVIGMAEGVHETNTAKIISLQYNITYLIYRVSQWNMWNNEGGSGGEGCKYPPSEFSQKYSRS